VEDELERMEADLARREARLRTFLRVRGFFGLLFLAVGAVGFGLAGAFLLAAVGALDEPALTQWTDGFNAILAVFLPSAFGWYSGERGWRWWRDRTADPLESACG
jgi:hypothetical protein